MRVGVIGLMNRKKPLVMTKQQLEFVLNPYCLGKQVLLDYVQDLWNSSTPLPNSMNGQIVKLIHPRLFLSFAKLVEQENGINVTR